MMSPHERTADAQTTSVVLMIRPASFGPNAETAATNAFQRGVPEDAREVLTRAQAEFDALAAALARHGVEVQVVEDTLLPAKPDALFPNNWLSFHPGGRIVLYPMLAANRRTEVRLDVLEELERRGSIVRRELIDLRANAEPGECLEGTGSLVLDRANRVAYACLSPRTTPALLARFGRRLGYECVAFHATDEAGIAIYHTNVMMSVGSRVALVCLESIRDAAERRRVEERLAASGHELVALSLAQISGFAGNGLELRTRAGAALFVLSERARRVLRPDQLATLERFATIVASDLSTIETHGGGSARCMLAEIF